MLWYFTDAWEPGRKCCCSRSFLPMLFLPDVLPAFLLCHFPFQTKILVLWISLLITGQWHLNFTLLKLKSKQPNLKVLQQCVHLGPFQTVLLQIFVCCCPCYPLNATAVTLCYPVTLIEVVSSARRGPCLPVCPYPAVQTSTAAQPPLLQMQCHNPPACKTALNKICCNFCGVHLRFHKACFSKILVHFVQKCSLRSLFSDETWRQLWKETNTFHMTDKDLLAKVYAVGIALSLFR